MGFWSTAAIIEAVGDDYQFLAFPPVGSGPKAKSRVERGGWVALVNGQGKHIPQATALQKWLWVDNTDWQIEWNTAYGYKALPRISLNDQVDRLKAGEPKHAVDMVNEYGYVVGQLWSGVMGTAVSDAVTNIVKNGADAKAEMQTAYDKCDGRAQDRARASGQTARLAGARLIGQAVRVQPLRQLLSRSPEPSRSERALAVRLIGAQRWRPPVRRSARKTRRALCLSLKQRAARPWREEGGAKRP